MPAPLHVRLAWATPALLALAGCVTDLDDVVPGDGAIPRESRGVIVGDLDWVEASDYPDAAPERVASRSVAYLWIPQMGHRCTGFLIEDDVIATARHCVPDAEAARGISAAFTYERGATSYGITTCGTFLGSDRTLDIALVRCASAPGYAPLAFVDTAPAEDDAVYLVHQNCDGMACDPTKKISPGHALGAQGAWLYHDADMLPGSSGGPLLDAALHAVVGLNFGEQPQNIDGRGSFNVATLATKLRDFVDQAGVEATWITRPPAGSEPPATHDDEAEADLPAVTSPAAGAHVTTEHVDLACAPVDDAAGYRFILEYEREPGVFTPYHTWMTTGPAKRVWPVRVGVRYRVRASVDEDGAETTAPVVFTYR